MALTLKFHNILVVTRIHTHLYDVVHNKPSLENKTTELVSLQNLLKKITPRNIVHRRIRFKLATITYKASVQTLLNISLRTFVVTISPFSSLL